MDHHRQWRHGKNDLPTFITTAKPFPSPGVCRVAACDRRALRSNGDRRLCTFHAGRWTAARTKHKNLAGWALTEGPAGLTNLQFWVGTADDNAVAELLFAVADRQFNKKTTGLHVIRTVAGGLTKTGSPTIKAWASTAPYSPSQRLAKDMVQRIDLLVADPDEEWERDLIRVRVIDPTEPHNSVLDVTVLKQSWLRSMFVDVIRRDWHASTTSSYKSSWLKALSALSEYLTTRSDRGEDPSVLGGQDLLGLRRFLDERFEPSGVRKRLSDLRLFQRRADELGLAKQFRPSFMVRAELLPGRDIKEVAAGERALPDATFSLLTGTDLLLGPRVLNLLRGVPRDDQARPGLLGDVLVMAIQLGANWGRRPTELLSLNADRIRLTDAGGAALRYDNFKSGRDEVWLPIDARQATSALQWTGRLQLAWPDTAVRDLKLLPRVSLDPSGTVALPNARFARWFRIWTYLIEQAIVLAKLAKATSEDIDELVALRCSDISEAGLSLGGVLVPLAAEDLAGLTAYRNDVRERIQNNEGALFPDPVQANQWTMADGRNASSTPVSLDDRLALLGDNWTDLASQYDCWGLPGEGLGRQRVTAHAVEWRRFRHTYLQHLVDAGVDIFLVQELADHRDIATTIGSYVRTRLSQLTEAVEQLSAHRINRFGRNTEGDIIALPSHTDVITNSCSNPQVLSTQRTGCDQGELCFACDFLTIDPSHLPDLDAKIFTLRKSIQRFEDEDNAARLTVARQDLEGWRQLRQQLKDSIDALPLVEQERVHEAAKIVRAHRNNQRAGNVPRDLPRPSP